MVILLIIAASSWNHFNTNRLMSYTGSYTLVEGRVSSVTYIGRKELFGPHRVAVQLSTGGEFVLLAEDSPPQFADDAHIVLQLPAEEEFFENGMPATHMFQVVK